MTSFIQLSEYDYINFLIASRCDVSCVKVAECLSNDESRISHDIFNRFLSRQSLTPEALWNEVEPFVERKAGWLVIDDTVVDKIYSQKIELTYFQWSGKHHKVVKGIGLITLVWTDGTHTFPIDYRIYDKDGDLKTKNDHFRDMLKIANIRKFTPCFVMFDSWYSGIDNLKFVDSIGWNWFTRVKKNRMVNPDRSGNVTVESLNIPDDGIEVHMKKYGFIRLFHSINKKGRDRFWATNFISMDNEDRRNLQSICWTIENYHRVLKEICSVEKCIARKETIQRNHINCSIRAFIRLEVQFMLNGITPYEAKWDITKDAVASYLQQPKYTL